MQKSNLYRWNTGELQVIHDKVSTTSYRTEELQVHACLNIENIRPNASTETLTSGWNLRYARLSCFLLNEIVIQDSMPNSDLYALTNLYCREILLCHDPCSSCLVPTLPIGSIVDWPGFAMIVQVHWWYSDHLQRGRALHSHLVF